MSSYINSDDGIVSGVAGLKYGADNSGALVLQTNGTTAITISAAQVVTFAGAVSLGALTTSGNLTFTGTGNRITGDFSNATAGSRVSFQSSTTNGATLVNLIPNGTSVDARIIAYENAADTANSSFAAFGVVNNEYRMTAGITGTGAYRPITMYTGGSERLRIDTSGNVGIGTTSPAQILEAVSSGVAYLRARSSASSFTGVDFGQTTSGEGRIIVRDAQPLSFYTNATERMRIDASGNVGIGTSSPYQKLTVAGAISTSTGFYLGTDASSIDAFTVLSTRTNVTGGGAIVVRDTYGTYNSSGIEFYAGGSERMRIDSNGQVLFGTTNASATAGNGTKFLDSSQLVSTVATYTTSAASNFLMYSTGVATYRFYVGWDGTIRATSTTITGISDQRLKENIVDLPDGLDAVMALKPRKFDWKAGKGKDIKGDRGFIAQEFEQVFPDMIEEWKDTPPEGEEPYKAVNANLIPTLVKAIQELNTKVTALEAQLAAK